MGPGEHAGALHIRGPKELDARLVTILLPLEDEDVHPARRLVAVGVDENHLHFGSLTFETLVCLVHLLCDLQALGVLGVRNGR